MRPALAPPDRARGAAPAQRQRGQRSRRGWRAWGKRTVEGARHGRLKEEAGRGAREAGRAEGGVAGRLRSCQSLKARAHSAGACFRRPGAFRPSSPSGPRGSRPSCVPGAGSVRSLARCDRACPATSWL